MVNLLSFYREEKHQHFGFEGWKFHVEFLEGLSIIKNQQGSLHVIIINPVCEFLKHARSVVPNKQIELT
jgi:hypothetical protein